MHSMNGFPKDWEYEKNKKEDWGFIPQSSLSRSRSADTFCIPAEQDLPPAGFPDSGTP